MAGFVAENILNKKSRIIQWRELAELPADTIRIDVRTHDEYKLGTIPGFINIPVDELREHLDELPKEKPIVVTWPIASWYKMASSMCATYPEDTKHGA